MVRPISSGRWVEDILGALDKGVKVETVDGVTRGGRVSGFSFRTFHLNGTKVNAPIELELNGDPNDRIPLDRILWINVEKDKKYDYRS